MDNTEQDRSHLGVVVDPNVKIKPSENLQEFIGSKLMSEIQDKKYLSIGDIKELYAAVKKKEGVYLNELIRGSDILIPGLVIPPRNPELEKRCEQLRKSLAQKEYARMTRDVDFSVRQRPEDSISFQMKQINSGLIGVFQFVVTVATAFMFGFMGIEVFASVQFELAVKLLLGIICALIVAGAELFFLLRTIDFAETTPPRPHQASPSLKQHLKTSWKIRI